MKNPKIPTIIGIILLIFGLAAGVILVENRAIFKLGASSQATPKNVRVSNTSSVSFSVSWTTDTQTTGFIKYGESSGNLGSTQTEETSVASFTHEAKLTSLKPDSQYYFKINSGGSDFDNSGIPWQQKTGPQIAEPEKASLISGSILTVGGAPSQNALVYVTLGGSLLSTLTSQNGSWVIPISQARSSDLSGFITVDEQATIIQISVEAGPDGVSSAQVYPQSARPVPTIILGQTYDFRSLPANQSSDIPSASLGVPDNSSPSSGFNISQGTATQSAKTVTLQSVSSNEVVTTATPEFFGQGPTGTKLSITVESETPISAGVTVAQDGTWKWDPPQNLAEGTHKITITWKDASGITRTLTRNFVVQASEGLAFVATPSATPKGSATPSANPTATPSATLTPSPTSSATPFPQPETGSLTPTILLSIMGIGLVSFAFLLWRESEV